MTDQWLCPQCQHTNADNMQFCPHCGAANPAFAALTAGPSRDKLAPPGRLNRRLLWAAAIGLWVIGCAVLAIGGWVWWSRQGRVNEVAPVAEAITTTPEATTLPSPTLTPTSTPLPPTATPEPATPTPTPRSKTGDSLVLPKPSATPTATPTLTPTATPKPAAPPPAPVASTCPSPGVQITSPRPGSVFTQRYNYIVGTANIPRFHHWKIEYSTNPSGGWMYLLERDYPVDNDKLIMLDTSTVPRGPYGLRLTVVDETGNYSEPCVVWFVNGY